MKINNTRMKNRLISLLEPCGITTESIVYAVDESFKELIRDGCNVHSWLLPLALWKIFDSSGFVFINKKTPAGNAIPFDVFTFAYAIWREARQKAIARGLDELDASLALIRVVNAVADCFAHRKCRKVRNLRGYMLVGYMKELKRIVQKIGIVPPRNLRRNEPQSDDGAFCTDLENAMLYDEILGDLSEKEEDAIAYRCIMGCSFEETANMMDLSETAVRQHLSRAMRKMGDIYRGNRAAAGRKAAKMEKHS